MRDSEDIFNLVSSMGELQYQPAVGASCQKSSVSQWPLLAAFDGFAAAASDLPQSIPAVVLKPVASTLLEQCGERPQTSGSSAPAQEPASSLRGAGPTRRFERLPSLQPDAPCPLIVAVTGAKGGAGRTTVAANLAIGLACGGYPVIALDMDPQNCLRHHLGLDPADIEGFACATLAGRPWSDALRSPSTVLSVLSEVPRLQVLPYGQLDDNDQDALDAAAVSHGDWLDRHLAELALPHGSIVVIDLPAHAGPCMRRVLEHAHLVLCVTPADVAAYMCQPQTERLIRRHCAPRTEFIGHFYVLNQLDGARRLTRDVTRLLKSEWKDRVIGTLHRDQCVPEALANRMSMIDHNPQAQAVQDMLACIASVAAHLATCSASFAAPARRHAA